MFFVFYFLLHRLSKASEMDIGVHMLGVLE